MKFVKRGKSQKKFFYLAEGLDKICWRDSDKKKEEGFILIDEIIAIIKGHTSLGKKNPRTRN